MSRARRHFLPGYAWHITHRCHDKKFPLKFARDRRNRMGRLHEARKRYGLSIPNEDRCHATAVEANHHLVACLTYIDLNMVRAGVVAHPSEWKAGGYAEMIAGRKGASISDYGALMELLNIESLEALREFRKNRVGQALARGRVCICRLLNYRRSTSCAWIFLSSAR